MKSHSLHSTFVLRRTASMLSLVFASLGAGVHAFELDGDWNIVSMAVPTTLVITEHPKGGIEDLLRTDLFHVSDGSFSVTGSTFSGFFDDSFSGSISASSSGRVTLRETDPDGKETTTFSINWSSDFMAAESADSLFQEITLATKRPASTVLADIEGTWNVVSMCTPAEIKKTFFDGRLADLMFNDFFDVLKGTMTVAGGAFTINFPGDVFGGAMAVSAPGVIQATPSGDLPFTLYLNASKDIMVAIEDETYSNALYVFLKAPTTCEQHELEGNWGLVSFSTPSVIVELRDQMNQLIGLLNWSRFHTETGQLFLRADGTAGVFFSGELPGSGSVILDAPGRATFNTPGDPAFPLCGNAQKDVFAGVGSESSFNEILIAVRSVKPGGLALTHDQESDEITLRWVGTPNRLLQQLTPPSHAWTDMPATLGLSSITLPIEGEEGLFRLVEQ